MLRKDINHSKPAIYFLLSHGVLLEGLSELYGLREYDANFNLFLSYHHILSNYDVWSAKYLNICEL